ncbi:ribonuclease H1-like [Leptopilina boulardi]|uniref:ribonuclease H1-like n=1 Tax=Leptopilina boulardi TaxID=63433 RepID=UPI0021F5EED9|nr:ribonuclease H1-like [Leptopilina boulardi]
MISRLQKRILQQLNNTCQRLLLPNVNLETNDINKKENIKIDDKQNDSTKIVKNINQNFNIDDDGFVSVYTDGSCSFNGLQNAKAGIGVWFGQNHPLNVSEPIFGRSTCNVAEIMAVTKAVNVAKEAGIKKLRIYTDSKFVVQSVTTWMPKWKINGWKGSKKKPVINKNELITLDEALKSIEVSWIHVSSHSGIHGNEMANLLAKEGIETTVI